MRYVEAENTLDKVMKKVSDGKELSAEDTKVLKAALTAAGGKDDDKDKIDAVMKKVADGKELSAEEKKLMSAAQDAEKDAKDEKKKESVQITTDAPYKINNKIYEKGTTFEVKESSDSEEDILIEKSVRVNDSILQKGDVLSLVKEDKKKMKESNGDYYVYPVVGSEKIPDKLLNRIYDNSYNGLMLDAELAMDSEAPVAWDAGFTIDGKNLKISGSVGASGYGQVSITVPLPRTKKDAMYRFLLEYSNEEESIEDVTELRKLGYIVEE